MTREEIAKKNALEREKRSKKLVYGLISGLFSKDYRKKSGRWNIKLIAEHTELHRDTVSKHLKFFDEMEKRNLFKRL